MEPQHVENWLIIILQFFTFQSGAQIGQRVGLSDKDTQKLNKMYCDADSDGGLADETPSKKTEDKKKNGKNKPFEGHGIGYHQGKAVAIKLLPAAETYKLPDVPSFHVFDYFSKEPQILSTSENEAFRIGKEIAYSYNPPEMSLTSQENDTPVDYIQPELKSEITEIKLEIQNNNSDNDAEVKQVKQLKETQLSDSKSQTNESNNGSETETTDPDLLDAFDRLSKIIKMHVYPSQMPDLSVYKANERYINHYNLQDMKKESEPFVSPAGSAPLQEEKSKDDKINSAIRFINNHYDLNLDKSFLYSSEKPHDAESEKYNNDKKNMNIKGKSVAVAPENDDNNKKHISSYTGPYPLNKQYDDEYVLTSGFVSPEHYADKNVYTSIYSPKIHNDEKPNEDENEWHHKYHSPYYPDHDYYTEYSKDGSKRPRDVDKIHENIYSSSIPVRIQEYPVLHVPTRMIKNWHKIKDASR